MTGSDQPARLEELRKQLADVEAQGRPQRTAAGPAPDGDEAPSDPAEAFRAAQQQAKAVCLRLLADSARPRANLEQALRRRGFEDDVIAAVLDRFTEVGLVDDEAYAAAYVRSKHRERGLARRALGAELRAKGIDPTTVTGALDLVDRNDEEHRAAALVSKRIDAAMAAGAEAARRRLLGLLARRGYPADVAIRVVDSALVDRGGDTSGWAADS